MLRISVATLPFGATLVLEGRLGGAWVDELAASWRDLVATRDARSIRIDLNNVTFVDAAARALLRALRESGATLVANDLLLHTIFGDAAPAGRRLRQAAQRGQG